jgi:hypothetical protein
MGRVQERRHELVTGEEAWEGYRRGGINRLQVRRHGKVTGGEA